MNPRFKEILSKGSILLGGSALAQLFTFLSYPILSHWIHADKWATFGVFSAVVTLFAVMANGGYEQAILLPKENEKAVALWKLCKRYTGGIALLSVILLLVKGMYKPEWLNELHFSGIIIAIFSSVYFEGSIISTVNLLNRAERYKTLATGRAIQAATTLLVQLLMAYQWPYFHSVLIWGWVAGQMVHFLWLNFHAQNWINTNLIVEGSTFQVASEYKRFFKFSVASSYINTLSRQLPFLILPFWITDELLGQFTFAHKILSAPLGLIGATITQVFNAQSSQAKRGEIAPIHTLTQQWSKWMLFLGLPVLIMLMGWGPSIFEWLFSDEYKIAGEMAQWLSPWLYLLYWISPLSNLISIENKLKQHFWYNLALLLARFIVLLGLATSLSGEWAVAGYCMVGALFALGMLIWLWMLSRDMKPWKEKPRAGSGMTILFTGDVCISGRFEKAMYENREIFSVDILQKFSAAQAVCINFEGAEFATASPRKQGEAVTNAAGSIDYLSVRGVNVFNLANNHTLDKGVEVAAETVRKILHRGDVCVGMNDKGQFSLDAHYICFGGLTVAILAIEEGNNRWDTSQLKRELVEIRENADYIVLQYHGGEEYSNIPFPFKRNRLDHLMHLDIDAVIAHHPHIAQPMIHQNNKWVAYSLGNFVFDIDEHKGRAGVDKGLIVEMTIDKNGLTCKGIPVTVNAELGMVEADNAKSWNELQVQFFQFSYWRQWSAECHRIRTEEAQLTALKKLSSSQVANSTAFASKWKSLMNPPRRSLFLGDMLHRLIFRFL